MVCHVAFQGAGRCACRSGRYRAGRHIIDAADAEGTENARSVTVAVREASAIGRNLAALPRGLRSRVHLVLPKSLPCIILFHPLILTRSLGWRSRACTGCRPWRAATRRSPRPAAAVTEPIKHRRHRQITHPARRVARQSQGRRRPSPRASMGTITGLPNTYGWAGVFALG